MNKNASIFLRTRTGGISFDECARLCLTEPSFICETLTYEPVLNECKWSSYAGLYDVIGSDPFFIEAPGVYLYSSKAKPPSSIRVFKTILNVFINQNKENQFYDFIEYPFKVATEKELLEISVSSEEQCAYECSKQTKFTCRSFNLCKIEGVDTVNFRCLLSDSHNHNTERDPNLIFSPICTHYSSMPFSFLIKLDIT